MGGSFPADGAPNRQRPFGRDSGRLGSEFERRDPGPITAAGFGPDDGDSPGVAGGGHLDERRNDVAAGVDGREVQLVVKKFAESWNGHVERLSDLFLSDA